MTGSALLTLAVLAGPIQVFGASDNTSSPFQAALKGKVVVRAQDSPDSGVILQEPQPYATFYQTPTYAAPGGAQPIPADPNSVAPGSVAPGSVVPGIGAPGYAAPLTSDPWLTGGAPMMGNPYDPYTPGGGIPFSYGLNGPQPYKYGWTERFNTGFIAQAGTQAVGATSGGAASTPGGDLSLYFLDYEKEYVTPLGLGWVFSFAPQYNLRVIDGPAYRRHGVGVAAPAGSTLPANPELPGALHRFGLGLKLSTQIWSGWTIEGGFNPAIAADLRSSLKSDAYLFDGHLVGFIPLGPQMVAAVGATYWDRVDSIVLPYAGVIWTPSDYVEIRALFPKSRASFFLGTPLGIPTWLYVQAEYHVEAYQTDIDNPRPRDLNADGMFGVPASTGELASFGPTRVQIEDWRVVGGLYWEGAWLTTFVEAGAVFGRSVSYGGAVRHFEVDDAFILNMGLRY